LERGGVGTRSQVLPEGGRGVKKGNESMGRGEKKNGAIFGITRGKAGDQVDRHQQAKTPTKKVKKYQDAKQQKCGKTPWQINRSDNRKR